MFWVRGGQAEADHSFPASESHVVSHPTSLLSGRGLPRFTGKAVGPASSRRGAPVWDSRWDMGRLFKPRLRLLSLSDCNGLQLVLLLLLLSFPSCGSHTAARESWRHQVVSWLLAVQDACPQARAAPPLVRHTSRLQITLHITDLSVPQTDQIAFYLSVFPEMFPLTLPHVYFWSPRSLNVTPQRSLR